MVKRKCFRIYIDESGDHTYKNLQRQENRYLCLVGCIFESEQYRIFARKLEDFKQKYPSYDPDFPPVLQKNKEIPDPGNIFGKKICETIKQNTIDMCIGEISTVIEGYSYKKKRSSNEDLFTLTLTGYPPPNYWIDYNVV